MHSNQLWLMLEHLQHDTSDNYMYTVANVLNSYKLNRTKKRSSIRKKEKSWSQMHSSTS